MATNDPNARAENDLTTKTATTKHHPRLEAARSWWTQAWNEGGVLYSLWDGVREAPDAGWHGMANWLRPPWA
ncbi:hypothetical protein ACFVY0_34230 [Streptomyces sp. NPDC058286]|uniref:hypothetical protein n=1 Tax=Streptomyces sp. NPDC058286 TaxID=3346422 RepID=UPI0036EA694C